MRAVINERIKLCRGGRKVKQKKKIKIKLNYLSFQDIYFKFCLNVKASILGSNRARSLQTCRYLSRGLQPLAYLLSAKTPTIPLRQILITLRVRCCLLQFKTTINLPECLHSPRPQPMID